jgi:hypothetical protein
MHNIHREKTFPIIQDSAFWYETDVPNNVKEIFIYLCYCFIVGLLKKLFTFFQKILFSIYENKHITFFSL